MCIPLLVIVAAVIAGIMAYIQWGAQWGATVDECTLPLTGDSYLADNAAATRIVMTRAVSIHASPETVWPWLAQMGRGAGWYSFDRLDNGGKPSARHIVSWIPEPQLGDAAAIGYLRHLEHNREIVWWVPGEWLMGVTTRMVINLHLAGNERQSRLIMRISADATGPAALLVKWGFMFIDTIMARQQLLGIKQRAEQHGNRTTDPNQPETGKYAQYQLYQTIYASGETIGVAGKEKASQWRQAAIDAGLINDQNK